ncbi:MAG: hypothetical protein AB9903_23425 [Vulcanimicrobiota bacterium]
MNKNQYTISLNELLKMVQEVSFKKCGDQYERKYGYLLESKFPNCEIFWKHFVVPFTKRIELKEKQAFENVRTTINTKSNNSLMIKHFTNVDFTSTQAASACFNCDDASSEYQSCNKNFEHLMNFIEENNIQGYSSKIEEQKQNAEDNTGRSGYCEIKEKWINKKDCSLLLRDGVDEICETIGALHYTIFLNIIYANQCLEEKTLCFFEDFYVKLVTISDLVDDLLLRVYILIKECLDQKIHPLQEMTEEEFLKKATTWYNKNYRKNYEHYYSKGKGFPMNLPTREDIVKEYFEDSEDWNEYNDFSKNIRTYRNVIIHNIQIGRINNQEKKIVPKLDKIVNFKKWSQVYNASLNEREMRENFTEMNTQMKDNLNEFMRILNQLWNKPINDLKKLLYEEKNIILLKKYNLSIQD